MKRRTLAAVLAIASGIIFSGSAVSAEPFPSRALKVVVPFAPGGNVDIGARTVANMLAEELGKPVVVENRTGAGGLVGARSVATAAPDGYTLLAGSSGSLTALEAITKNMPFSVERDFTPIALLNLAPMAVIVGPGSKAANFAQLLVEAKAQPGTLCMASAGTGSSNHLAIELLQTVTGAKFLHVPYKGSGQALADVLAGHCPTMIDQVTSSVSYVRRGQLRALALMMPTRSSQLPDVPTMKELGYDAAEAAAFTGILAPAGLPADVAAVLERAVLKAANRPEVTRRFLELGAEPRVIGSSEFRRFIETDLARWKNVAQRANISVEN